MLQQVVCGGKYILESMVELPSICSQIQTIGRHPNQEPLAYGAINLYAATVLGAMTYDLRNTQSLTPEQKARVKSELLS